MSPDADGVEARCLHTRCVSRTAQARLQPVSVKRGRAPLYYMPILFYVCFDRLSCNGIVRDVHLVWVPSLYMVLWSGCGRDGVFALRRRVGTLLLFFSSALAHLKGKMNNTMVDVMPGIYTRDKRKGLGRDACPLVVFDTGTRDRTFYV